MTCLERLARLSIVFSDLRVIPRPVNDNDRVFEPKDELDEWAAFFVSLSDEQLRDWESTNWGTC